MHDAAGPPTTPLNTTQKVHATLNKDLANEDLPTQAALSISVKNNLKIDPASQQTGKQTALTQDTVGFLLLYSTWAHKRWFPRKAC